MMRLLRPLLLSLGVLVWLMGCSGDGATLDFDEEVRLLDACKGVEHVPAANPDDPPDTSSMIPAEEATDERAAAELYEQFYCGCLVDVVEGSTADARDAFVSDPPAPAREECESGAYDDTMADPDLGLFLPDDPLGWLGSHPPGTRPTVTTGS